MEGEEWKAAIQRASKQMREKGLTNPSTKPKAKKAPKAKVPKAKVPKAKTAKNRSDCVALPEDDCDYPCKWTKESKAYTSKTGKAVTRKAHCGLTSVRSKTASSISQALEKSFPKEVNYKTMPSEEDWEINEAYRRAPAPRAPRSRM
jgi:hypothetical protein